MYDKLHNYSFSYMYDVGIASILVAWFQQVYTSSVGWVASYMMYELEIIYYA